MKKWIMGSLGDKKSVEIMEEYIEKLCKKYRRQEIMRWVLQILAMGVVYFCAFILADLLSR